MLLISVLVTIVSFTVSLTLTPVVRNRAARWGLVDQPGDRRKIHVKAVPRVGGVAVLAAYLSALCVAWAASGWVGASAEGLFRMEIRLVPALVIVFVTGLFDDVFGLRPWQKLAGQTVAAVIAVSVGVQTRSFAGQIVGDWWSAPLTVLWIVACSNAFNLIDGVDGLAAGLGVVATLAVILAGLLDSDHALAVASLPLFGALCGFLRFNFSPASIFLGDSGSLSVGFLLGCYGVVWSQKSATVLGMTAPIMALAVPLLDMVLAVVRRMLRGQPIFCSDRAHIHHKLLDLGFPAGRVALLLYCAGGGAAGLALLQSVVHNEFRGIIVAVFCVIAWLGVRRLNYQEFGLAARLLRGAPLRELIGQEIRLQQALNGLAESATFEQCWNTLRSAAGDFGFCRVVLYFRGKTYREVFPCANQNCWTVRIPLAGPDYVDLDCAFGTQAATAELAKFVEQLRQSLILQSTRLVGEPVLPRPGPYVAVAMSGRTR